MAILVVSETSIYNMALSQLGGNQINPIQDGDEDSQEAIFCKMHYNTVKQNALSSFPWGFASKLVELALLPDKGTHMYPFCYQMPVDCLYPTRLSDDQESDGYFNYQIIGEQIRCRLKPAWLQYVCNFYDTTKMPAYFVDILVYGLAKKIAMVNRNDPNMVTLMAGLFDEAMGNGITADRKKYQPRQPQDQWVAAHNNSVFGGW